MSRFATTVASLTGLSIEECHSLLDLERTVRDENPDSGRKGIAPWRWWEESIEESRCGKGSKMKVIRAVLRSPLAATTTTAAAAAAVTDHKLEFVHPNTSPTSHVTPNSTADAEDASVQKDERQVEQTITAGFAVYMNGYIELSKTDPFTAFAHGRRQLREAGLEVPWVSSAHDTITITTVVAAAAAAAAAATEKGERDLPVHLRQAYIRAIRGKKHIYIAHLAVHPAYQGRGVDKALTQYIAAEADRETIVAWTFTRPATAKLVREYGFVDVKVESPARKKRGKANGEDEDGDEAEEDPLLRAMLRMPRLPRAPAPALGNC